MENQNKLYLLNAEEVDAMIAGLNAAKEKNKFPVTLEVFCGIQEKVEKVD